MKNEQEVKQHEQTHNSMRQIEKTIFLDEFIAD